MSAPALAEALEISVRTLYRDIDELTAAGVPVYAERGRAGGFQLLPGWRTTLTGLTPAEAQAVFLGGLGGPAGELGLGRQVQSAQLKLLSALPADWRGHAQRVSTRLHLDPVDWYREPPPAGCLPTVAGAVWEERQLEIDYEGWVRTARQVVHPLGLVLKAGVWYLVASRERKVRTYRVAGIRQARVLDARCRRPRRFDLARHWAQAVRRFEVALYAGQAEVLATAQGLADLRRQNAAVARALQDVHPPAAPGARVKVRIPTESVQQAAGPLMRLAPEVEVLTPVQLRQAIADRLHAAAERYGLGGPACGRP
ncbi:transcriptional regulator, DeoR family-like protein [Ramlibacter tataouinensis TTB310]|uniref:Transcriptional regulator, DeoR family-like protein n=2 Tax=Ramlibacter tataouinensis TaxID=94132 RepID=F5Y5X0_RAMTT|nr:transcriptional regulator, DeoR family-like protein [Ramlibacter tataouinensis TTB310]